MILRFLFKEGNPSSNRVEGFFGTFKKLLDHKRVSFDQIVRSICILARTSYLASMKERYIETPKELMSIKDSYRVGKKALQIVNAEYKEFVKERNNQLIKQYAPNCCEYHVIYNIPCTHLMNEKMNNNYSRKMVT